MSGDTEINMHAHSEVKIVDNVDINFHNTKPSIRNSRLYGSLDLITLIAHAAP